MNLSEEFFPRFMNESEYEYHPYLRQVIPPSVVESDACRAYGLIEPGR